MHLHFCQKRGIFVQFVSIRSKCQRVTTRTASNLFSFAGDILSHLKIVRNDLTFAQRHSDCTDCLWLKCLKKDDDCAKKMLRIGKWNGPCCPVRKTLKLIQLLSQSLSHKLVRQHILYNSTGVLKNMSTSKIFLRTRFVWF